MKFQAPFLYLVTFAVLYVILSFVLTKSNQPSWSCDHDDCLEKQDSKTTFEEQTTGKTKPLQNAPEQLQKTPPPLLFILDVNEDQVRTFSNHSFLQPRVFKTYIRPSLNRSSAHPNAVDVFLFSLGLQIRDLSASHCLIGDKLYPAQSFYLDVTCCTVPNLSEITHLNEDAVITVVIDPLSKGFQTALGESLKLEGGHVAERLLIGQDIFPYRYSNLTLNKVVKAEYGFEILDQFHKKAIFLAAQSDETKNNITLDDFDPRLAQTQKRYAVCMATMTATSPHILSSWVDYHRTIGVDHVYIFDNGLKADVNAMFQGRSDVEVIRWPWQKTQIQSMSFMLLAARRRCQILFKPDTDEYVLLGLNPDNDDNLSSSSSFADDRRPLHAFLQNRRDRFNTSSMTITSLVFCNSGYITKPRRAPPLSYIHVRQKPELRTGKPFCDTMQDFRTSVIHSCGVVGSKDERYECANEQKDPITKKLIVDSQSSDFWEKDVSPSTVSQLAWLMHFYERSWEEWVEKWEIGVAVSSGVKRDNMISRFNVSNPNSTFLDMTNDRCEEYTHFKKVFEIAMRYRDKRIRQSVLVWHTNSTIFHEILTI